ncbi:HisA/HisF-related TIM barrel protein [Rubripirellula sp.]|nr:HisA/HisF-related TIM barrel protein [Rubripirellula sp.]MDB4338857.1 HisA/HisF-related TIM barrel protein [Rubripirellula sp.]
MNEQLGAARLTAFKDEVQNLIGVIDLLRGRAVHAVAGKRHAYQGVDFCGGDYLALVRHYQNLGIGSFYIADLDAIQGGTPGWHDLSILAEECSGRAMIDIGWRGGSRAQTREVISLGQRWKMLKWLVATETCRDLNALQELADLVDPERLCLSLDFRDGQFLSTMGSWQDWVDCGQRMGIRQVVVLDIAAVGRMRGAGTSRLCQEVAACWPDLCLYSGGGVREVGDIKGFLDVGCEAVLIATALYPAR